eukprot:CAMPEP_0170647652 /NCGR_PEP_ID=MMETSP0224-20130122/44296_2 /TAXON_ID=285029 /ORGANISM="Togula jolla, Strain CCCM 725" /LENGTH=281 /DNA_ID=CAMNT_0010979087 /DNA_START=439 /DNA_END=1286 /DNA_ORIENTATION=-
MITARMAASTLIPGRPTTNAAGWCHHLVVNARPRKSAELQRVPRRMTLLAENFFNARFNPLLPIKTQRPQKLMSCDTSFWRHPSTREVKGWRYGSTHRVKDCTESMAASRATGVVCLSNRVEEVNGFNPLYRRGVRSVWARVSRKNLPMIILLIKLRTAAAMNGARWPNRLRGRLQLEVEDEAEAIIGLGRSCGVRKGLGTTPYEIECETPATALPNASKGSMLLLRPSKAPATAQAQSGKGPFSSNKARRPVASDVVQAAATANSSATCSAPFCHIDQCA